MPGAVKPFRHAQANAIGSRGPANGAGPGMRGLTVGITHQEALAHPGHDPESYRRQGAPAIGLLNEGDTVDLGGATREVWHLPGHSPRGNGLFDREAGTLLAADATHHGPLIYRGPGMGVRACRETFAKLRALPVTVVRGGHDPSFTRDRMLEIIATDEARWEAEEAALAEQGVSAAAQKCGRCPDHSTR